MSQLSLSTENAPQKSAAVRTKFLFQREQRPVAENDDIVTAFRDGQVTLRKNRRTEGFTNSIKEIGYQGVRAGDLVVHAMDAFAGAVGISDSDGKATPVYSVCTPKRDDIYPPFYARLLRHLALSGFIESLSKGVRERSTEFRWAELSEIQLPVPPREEQERIANFLDEQTARIDALIAEKERLTSVLAAMKSDAIDTAVFGGGTANSGQPLKGLEVLGAIPEGWKSSRMKFEVEYVTSGSRGWAEHYADNGALFVRIGNLTRDSIELNLSDVQRVALPDSAEGVRARVHQGDLLISITAYLGSVAVAPADIEEAYVSQHVSLARPNCRRALPKWLGYVVLSSIGRTFFDLQAYGGTKVQLSLDDIRELPVPLPQPEVQRERIDLLEARLRSLDELATHAQEHIARLREYRSSLISAAVTGQLDLSTFKAAA